MKRYQGGLTLLELLITIALAAILVGIGIPSFTRMLQAAQVRQWTGDINSFVGLARTEGVRLNLPNRNIIIQPSGADWSTEWIMGPDTNGDGSVTGAEILHRMNGIAGDDFSMVDVDGDAVEKIEFNSQGWPVGDGTLPFTIAFQASECKDDNRRVMTLKITGGMATADPLECV